MTREEVAELRKDMQKAVKLFTGNIREYCEMHRQHSMDDLMDISDMLKDMSEVEKNIAKADYYDRKIS